MKFIKTLLASVAFMVAASSANAAPVVKQDLGPISSLTWIDPVTVTGAIDDIFTFSLNVPAADFSANKLVLTLGQATIWDFSNLTFSVYQGTFGSDVVAGDLLHSVNITSPASSVEFSLNGLTAGDFYIQVAGTTSGLGGGTYTFAIAPVPEPSSVAMLLVGFAALGAVARRRSKSL